MESEALRKSTALLEEINRTMQTESVEEDIESQVVVEPDHLATQLGLLIDSCAIILERSKKLAESVQRATTSHVQQVDQLCSRYISQAQKRI